ncbi:MULTISPECIES: hypothetical protein [unclassified Leptolyngbya]|uniref:hypothetical protein n=1 Tax=unclassified Leptolyngbya TaxID=2650499 RepID=UPI001685FA3E|nr:MULTISPECIES: hypothetical protein [unclassified Leptolyngbya]MBD1910074.1 hypothetical protein [Leptolyngbya sp. FACHB-8]MBD2158747.1 hypothetical protein [Leptolyngbya sp. FACHB-16]
MDTNLLQNRDYTLIIARTADEFAPNPPHFSERWNAALESIVMLAQTCETFDPDGITLYVACQGNERDCEFLQYENVTSGSLLSVIKDNYPPRKVQIQTVLKAALDSYFTRKTAGQTQPNGEMLVILLDGEPEDRMAVARTIREATHQMDSDEELGISFLQIGDNAIATGFLTALDENLQEAGAAFDIVHTRHLETIQPESITQFLLNTLNE